MPYEPDPVPEDPRTADKRAPLGVPKGYTVERPNPNVGQLQRADVMGVDVPVPRFEQATMPVSPRYFAGHEHTPASLPTESIIQVQRDLLAAGLIGPKTTFRLGVWDSTSRNAYRNLLEFANTYGYDEGTALEIYAQAPQVNASGAAAGGALPRTRLTNPDDLAQIVDVVAKATIGRRVEPEFVQRFVSAYQRAEYEESAGANDPSGGTFVSAPDPQTMAEEMLREERPDDAFRQDAIQMFNVLGKTLTGPAGFGD